MDSRLDGRRVLVTGASSGIGRAVAAACADAGARVALLARRVEVLEEVRDTRAGDGHAVGPCDVADATQVRTAVDAAADALGGLDAVVNSAGLVRPETILEADPAGWRAMFDVNVLGLLAVTQAAVPHLRQAPLADVVNLSSMSGRRRSSAVMTVYAASKHAVHVVSDGLREELTPLGIRTTIVSPGFVATPIFATGEHDTAHTDALAEAANRVGLPPELVAEQVVGALALAAGSMVFEVALLSMEQ